MDEYTVFMDESGNTGSNHLDFSQPVFVFSGIGIDHTKMRNLEQEALIIKAKHRIPRNQELHAKNLFRRRKEYVISDFIDLIFKHDVMLFFSIAEKEFAIATYVDSEFFDPVYNDKCDNTWTHPSPKKNERSNFFYENLSQETLVACGNAFRSGDGMKHAYDLVRRDIQGKPYEIDLYDILGGAGPYLERLAGTISSIQKSSTSIGIPTGVLNTPNFFCFSGMIQKIDDFYAHIDANSVLLVFDSSKEYNVTFTFMVERLISTGKHITLFPGGSFQTLGFHCVKSFRCEDSKNSIFLQLSDLVATSIRNIIQKIYWDDGVQQYSKFESFIIYLIVSHRDEFQTTFTDLVVSDSLWSKVIRTFFDRNRHEILKR